MSLKDKISSPLEAGTSLLDAQHLPDQLTPALEYASARLARKSLRITLVVARRDYQLPPSPVLCSPLGSPASPSQNRFTKHLPRWTRHGSMSSASSATASMPNSPRSVISSPAYTPMSLEFPRNHKAPLSPRSPIWPLTPMTPRSPPMLTPNSALSSSKADYGFPVVAQQGIRFIHHPNLPAKAEKVLQSALSKAGRKSGTGVHIAPALNAAKCGLDTELINRSVEQQDILFASEGLELISFDRLYSLKAALSLYSKTGSPLRLEDAVDELRRYVLATGRKVKKSDLLLSYDWLSVTPMALADLDRMYRRAYGGVELAGGIEGIPFRTIPEASAWSDDEDDQYDVEADEFQDEDSGICLSALPDSPTVDLDSIGLAVSTTPVPVHVGVAVAVPVPLPILTRRPPSPKLPLLRVETSFEKRPAYRETEDDTTNTGETAVKNTHEIEEEPATARPDDADKAAARGGLWQTGLSIDQVLSAGPDPPPAEACVPPTPNGYDDISPITRGEWGFLLVDKGFQGARTVAVEAI